MPSVKAEGRRRRAVAARTDPRLPDRGPGMIPVTEYGCDGMPAEPGMRAGGNGRGGASSRPSVGRRANPRSCVRAPSAGLARLRYTTYAPASGAVQGRFGRCRPEARGVRESSGGRARPACVRCHPPPGRWRALWPRVAWRHKGCRRGRRRPTRERGGPPLRNGEATPTRTVGGWLILANDAPAPGFGAQLALCVGRIGRRISRDRGAEMAPASIGGIRPIVDRPDDGPPPAQR
jgi:hypothetical protein